MVTGVAPKTLISASAIAGWRSVSAPPWNPSVRAAFLRAETGMIDVPGGVADFTWTVGRVDGCAMIVASRHIRLGPCARVEAGALDVRGGGVGGQAQHSLWIAAGPIARLESEFLGSLFLEFAIGPTFHSYADSFYFRPERPSNTYTVPMDGLDAEVGLAVHFL
jgi:hypothetical protein